jgi:small subunit ribosomal protein S15
MTTEEKPEWVTLKPAEIEKLVIELGKQGESPSKIGIILRDKHGIPKVKITGKRIAEILSAAGVNYKSEQERVKEKITVLEKHISKNTHDYTAKRALTKKLWLVKK